MGKYIDFNETYQKLAKGELASEIRRLPDTAILMGESLYTLCKKELYSVITNDKGKPIMLFAAFIIKEGTATTEPDIRFGISRCHKDRFSLKKGMKIAKLYAFTAPTCYGFTNCWMSTKYWVMFNNFKDACTSMYDCKIPYLTFSFSKKNSCRHKTIIARDGTISKCYKCNKLISRERYSLEETKNVRKIFFNKRK